MMTQENSALTHLTGVFTAELNGERLDRGLATLLRQLSRSRAKLLIEAGAVKVNGRIVTQPSTKIAVGEKVIVDWQAGPIDSDLAPCPMELAIVYEDQHLLVIDKPAGLVVHPGPGHSQDSLVNGLIAHCGAEFLAQQGNRAWRDLSELQDDSEEAEPEVEAEAVMLRPGIVHRLDKDTSGLLVVAKNDAAYIHLAAQFAAHSIERSYHALVWGLPVPRQGSIDGNIGRSPKDRKIRTVLRQGGQTAITHYRHICHWNAGSDLKSSQAAISLIEARLETGRTHQIRVHMTHSGYPVVGDPVYGRPSHLRDAVKLYPALARAVQPMQRQALHAVILGFVHPVSGEKLRFESPPAKDFQDMVRRLDMELPRENVMIKP